MIAVLTLSEEVERTTLSKGDENERLQISHQQPLYCSMKQRENNYQEMKSILDMFPIIIHLHLPPIISFTTQDLKIQ